MHSLLQYWQRVKKGDCLYQRLQERNSLVTSHGTHNLTRLLVLIKFPLQVLSAMVRKTNGAEMLKERCVLKKSHPLIVYRLTIHNCR